MRLSLFVYELWVQTTPPAFLIVARLSMALLGPSSLAMDRAMLEDKGCRREQGFQFGTMLLSSYRCPL